MSGPNIAEDEGKPKDKVLYDCVSRVLRCMGVQKANDFSKHAQSCTHEDCSTKEPVGVEEASGKVVVNGELTPPPSSRPSFDHLCPPRLRSLLPPNNFGAVVPGEIYRSSFPQVENIEFLKTLGLKTIITLVDAEYPEVLNDFVRESGINHVRVLVSANKGAITVEDCVINQALKVVLDRSQHPILIHCNKGKHRTGCVVACFRKCRGEPLPSIIEEYHTYAAHKARLYDETFIELFDERPNLWLARANGWRPDDVPCPKAGLGFGADEMGWIVLRQVPRRVRS